MPLTAAVMVTTPQEVALMDVRKAINLFEQVRVPIVGIVENMSYFEQDGRKHYLFGKGGGERLAKEKGVPYLGGIPMDPALCECGDAGMSLFARRDAHALPAAAAFLDCAEAVVQQVRCLKQQGPLIKKIAPKDAHAFWIEWNDGKRSEYRLSELQKHCPCAQCAETKPAVDPEVKATGIVSVGRYALRVEFTSGCASGIYSYDLLRGMAGL
jgi:ATP-binding protein involved in chromosome partitioning